MKGRQTNPNTTKKPTKKNQNKPDPNFTKLSKKSKRRNQTHPKVTDFLYIKPETTNPTKKRDPNQKKKKNCRKQYPNESKGNRINIYHTKRDRTNIGLTKLSD
jgi:hypothetical protein